MTATIYDIISANSILNKILKYEFTGKQSFLISRILRTLSIEAESFYKTREQLLIKYGEKNDNNEIITIDGVVKISEENKKIFQKEINELLYANLELNIEAIPLEWLNDIKITPQEMLALTPFISID